MNIIDRIGYATRQSARVSWYMGHYLASQRFRPEQVNADIRLERPRKPGPGLARIMEEMGKLFALDYANAEQGLYPVPIDYDPDVLSRSRRYFSDLPLAAQRRAERKGTEVYSPDRAKELPAYFLQNFHFQTGGYLTEESALLYDTQVEVLFSGTANAMRRQCIVPIAEFMHGKDQRKAKLLDVACGTGRFVRFVKQGYPRLSITGCDLSEAYLEEAREHVKPYSGTVFKFGMAEALPFESETFDIVSSIYLYHEVPPKVRREIAREFYRVLKPGGILVFMDSLQTGDICDFDGLLESFPISFHEPYYPSYIKEDLRAILGEAGLQVAFQKPVFLSKLMVARRPP